MKTLLVLVILTILFGGLYLLGQSNKEAYSYCLANGGDTETCQVAFQ